MTASTLKSADFEFSPHAIDRMLDMAVDAPEVIRAMQGTKITDPQGFRWIGERVTVFAVWDPRLQKHVVTTVVWKTEDLWRKDMSIAPCRGREVKL
ncbi:hypothetical protein SEA_TRAX_50 [Gordonia phage Trax]|uniref:DUF4258 domain-containing protein n=1 Tax=Gordonia phage Trax TaxID=2591121 RepID=A0A515MH14_9CAUD|nr:hypothetical protein L3Y20_gp050 [Gordonia phage Trax]QDM55937.1 hypothetical protein SEA_TRAX_50 [Gordonia phage Trax]